MLARLILKSFQLSFSSMWTENFQMHKLGFEEAEAPEITSPLLDYGESKKVPEKHLLLLIVYAKAFDCVDRNKFWKILQEPWVPDHITCLLRNSYVGQEAAKPDLEQWTGSKLGKEYDKAAYYHFAYLTYMQSISCEMPGWMNHKLK